MKSKYVQKVQNKILTCQEFFSQSPSVYSSFSKESDL